MGNMPMDVELTATMMSALSPLNRVTLTMAILDGIITMGTIEEVIKDIENGETKARDGEEHKVPKILKVLHFILENKDSLRPDKNISNEAMKQSEEALQCEMKQCLI